MSLFPFLLLPSLNATNMIMPETMATATRVAFKGKGPWNNFAECFFMMEINFILSEWRFLIY
jgi:hypothetical protein